MVTLKKFGLVISSRTYNFKLLYFCFVYFLFLFNILYRASLSTVAYVYELFKKNVHWVLLTNLSYNFSGCWKVYGEWFIKSPNCRAERHTAQVFLTHPRNSQKNHGVSLKSEPIKTFKVFRTLKKGGTCNFVSTCKCMGTLKKLGLVFLFRTCEFLGTQKKSWDL